MSRGPRVRPARPRHVRRCTTPSCRLPRAGSRAPAAGFRGPTRPRRAAPSSPAARRRAGGCSTRRRAHGGVPSRHCAISRCRFGPPPGRSSCVPPPRGVGRQTPPARPPEGDVAVSGGGRAVSGVGRPHAPPSVQSPRRGGAVRAARGVQWVVRAAFLCPKTPRRRVAVRAARPRGRGVLKCLRCGTPGTEGACWGRVGLTSPPAA